MKGFVEIGPIKSLKLLNQIKQNNLSVMVDLGNENSLSCIKLGFKKILLPSSVELLHSFFNKDQKTLVKTQKAQYYTSKAIGVGLVTTDQEAWIKKRAEVKGIFNIQQINSLINIVQDSICHQLEQAPGFITLNELFSSISVNVIGHTFFGIFSTEDGEKIRKEVNQMVEPVLKKIISPFPFFVDPFSKLISRARVNLFGILENNIARARVSPTDNLVKQYYMTGNCTADISNIFVAGFETTSNTLFWLFYEISRNPSVKERLTLELNTVSNSGNYQDLLQQIPYSIACVYEVLRLYPPVWIMSRTSTEKFSIENFEVPANTDIILSPYLFHRLDKYWNAPDQFDPLRFLNTEIALSDRPYYFPFGIGARACIGERLALIEIYLILLNVFQKYSFAIESKEVASVGHFTLRPAEVISITLSKKK